MEEPILSEMERQGRMRNFEFMTDSEMSVSEELGEISQDTIQNISEPAMLFNRCNGVICYNQAASNIIDCFDLEKYSEIRELSKDTNKEYVQKLFENKTDQFLDPSKKQVDQKIVLSTPLSVKLYKIDNDNYIGYDFFKLSSSLDSDSMMNILDQVTDFIIITDDLKNIVYINKSGLKLLGYTEENIDEIQFSKILENSNGNILSNIIKDNKIEYFLVHKNGNHIPVCTNFIFHSWSNKLFIWCYGTRKDTLQLTLDNEDVLLHQHQRLEAIGTIASGIAHEINNPLTGIINYAQLIKDKIQDEHIKEYAYSIITEGQRVGNIVQNLLEFSRHCVEKFKGVILGDVLDSTLALMSSAFRKSYITVNTNYSDNLPIMYCKPQQIQQVFINLLTNAQNALNKRFESYDDNKVINIEIKKVKHNKRSYLKITFEDYGIGIPSYNMQSIFKPWFTTCISEGGTGLGLPVSLNIINQHQGFLKVRSEEGKYTQFMVYLPEKQTDAVFCSGNLKD